MIEAQSTRRRPVVVGAAALATAIAALAAVAALVTWPGFALLCLALVAIAIVTWRDPAVAIWLALALFCFEGAIKASLAITGMPVDADPRTVGALLIDLGLAIPVLAVIARDRLATPRRVWGEATGFERLAAVLLGAWLAISVLQVFQGNDAHAGLEGFRLSQSYLVLALVGLILFSGPRRPTAAVVALSGLIAGYALLRLGIGYSEAERGFVSTRDLSAYFETTFRLIGSFQSSVALVSFATPALAFCLTLGLLDRRRRLPALACSLALGVAVVASYVRTPLIAIAIAIAAGLLAGRSGSGRAGRSWLRIALVGAAAVIAIVIAAALVARGSPIAQDRFEGLLNPGQDESLEIRLDTYETALDDFASEPFGRGLGTVGHASEGPVSGSGVTTDNSFLKVLIEQGIEGIVLFAGGILGLTIAALRRLRRAGERDRIAGAAAFAGFLAFALLLLAGEYIEQPGKVLAWLLFGAMVAAAFRPRPDPGDRTDDIRGDERDGEVKPGLTPAAIGRAIGSFARSVGALGRVAWLGLLALLLALALGLTASREPSYRAAMTFTAVDKPFLPAPGIDYWRALADRLDVQGYALLAVQLRDQYSLFDTVTFEPGVTDPEAPATPGVAYYTLALSRSTPDAAAGLIDALANALGYGSVVEAGQALTAEAESLAALPPPEGAAAAARRERRIATLTEMAQTPPQRGIGAPAVVEAPSRAVDEIVDALPGPLPPRPSFVWAALAAIVTWLAALSAWWLWLSRPRPGGSPLPARAEAPAPPER